MNLTEQLQQLAPLAAQATEGEWRTGYDSEESCYRITAPIGGSEIEYYLCNELEEEDAAFIAAARNLLTPANIAALLAAVQAPAPGWIAANAGLSGARTLPAQDEKVLLRLKHGNVAVGQLTWTYRWLLQGGAVLLLQDVTHYHPLPAALAGAPIH